jgi:hypothetical protein
MALQNYSDLQSAVAGWLQRTDLTDRIPDFISLAESRLNRTLHLRVMEEEAALTILDQATTVALPAGFVEPVALWVAEDYGRRPLRYLSPVQGDTLTSVGIEYEWTIKGAEVSLYRPTGGALNLVLRYRKSFSLSDNEPTNWLLTNHPDAYLFATLVEAAPYLRDTEALAIWTSRLQTALDEINAKEARSEGLSSLTTWTPLPSNRRAVGNGGYGYYG